MKIKRVKWKNHPILGNLLLDFVKSNPGDGSYETVVFAGENGTGKSTILEELSSFLNHGSFNSFEYIEFVIDSNTYKAIPTTDVTTHPNFFDIEHSDGNITKIRSDRQNNAQLLESNPIDIRRYGCVFSRARSDYKTPENNSNLNKQTGYSKI